MAEPAHGVLRCVVVGVHEAWDEEIAKGDVVCYGILGEFLRVWWSFVKGDYVALRVGDEGSVGQDFERIEIS